MAHPTEESQDFRGAMAAVSSVPMRPVFLSVVVLDPTVVGSDEFFPALGFLEEIIRHSALNVERGLDEILPGLPLLDRLFGDTQRPVDRSRLVGFEDLRPVADQHSRGAVSLDRRVQHSEVCGEVLAGGEGACQYAARVVLQDGDRVDLLHLRQTMVYVADVHAPYLVPLCGLEWHILLLLGTPPWLLTAVCVSIEPPVRWRACRFAPSGPMSCSLHRQPHSTSGLNLYEYRCQTSQQHRERPREQSEEAESPQL